MHLHRRLLCSTVVILLLVQFSSLLRCGYCGTSSAGCGKCGTFYTAVNATESIQDIAAFCNTTIASLLQQNPASSYNATSVLSAGDSLDVFCSGQDSLNCGPCGARYVSNGSENASAIADKCSIQAVQLGPFSLTDVGEVVSIPCNVDSLQSSPFQCGICGTVLNISADPTFSVPLDMVAASCNATVAAVEALNPDQSNSVFGCSKIYIPCLGQPPICGPCGNSYLVSEGDTFFKTAAFCNVTLEDLMNANLQEPDPENLNIGDLLNVPCALDPKIVLMQPSSSQRSLPGGFHTRSLWWLTLSLSPTVYFFLQSI